MLVNQKRKTLMKIARWTGPSSVSSRKAFQVNQKSKNLFASKTLWLSCKLLCLLATALSIFAFTGSVTAQYYTPANSSQQSFAQPNLGGWTPPNTTGSVYRNNGSATARYDLPAARPPASVSFPESVAPFEAGIRTANYEATSPDLAADISLTDRIDGAATTFSKWKDFASKKVTSLLDGAKQDGGWLHKIQTFIGTSDVKKMVGSLTLVLGLYFAFVWVMRKLNLGGNSSLPSDVVEVLGQVPFGARRSLQLIRLGSKVLLLLNSPDGTQPLGEIADPGEVERLVSLCQGKRKSRSQSTTAVQQAAAQITSGNNLSPNVSQPSIGNVGTSSLNEVIKILQQAANPGRAVFEA